MPTPEEIQAAFNGIPNVTTPVATDPQAAFKNIPRTATGGNLSLSDYWESEKSPQEKEVRKRLAEQESIDEQWEMYFLGGIGAAAAVSKVAKGVPLAGSLIHGATTSAAATIAELGVIKPLSKHAGRIHPWLEPIVGMTAGVGSAMTLERLLSAAMIKSLTKTAPKFWTEQLDAIAKHSSIPEKHLADLRDLAIRTQNGDVEAGQELLIALNKKAYQDVATSSDEQLAKYWSDIRAKEVSSESTEVVTKEVSESVTAKGHLDDVDYERISRVAERDAIHEYTEEFDKLRKTIVNEKALAEWSEYPAKEAVDHIIARGGVTEKSVRNIFKGHTDDAVEGIVSTVKKRFPKLIVEVEAESPVTLAKELGYTDSRRLISDIADAPGLKRITRQKQMEFLNEFDRVYRDEIFIRTQEKTAKYLAKVLGADELVLPPPGAARKGHTIIGEAVREIEAGVPMEGVVKEIVTVRATVDRLANVIRKQTAKATGKKGKEALLKLRTEHAEKVGRLRMLHSVQKGTARIQSRLKNIVKNQDMYPEYSTQIKNFLRPLFGGAKVRLDENMFQFLTRKYNEKLAFGADMLARRYDDMLNALGTRPFRFKDLTYRQIKDIDDFAKAFSFVAKNEKTVVTEGGRMWREAVSERIYLTAKTSVLRPKMPTKTQAEDLAKGRMSPAGKFMQAASDIPSGFLAHLKRMEPILRQLDGFKEGMAHSTLFRPFINAETMAHRLGDNVFGAYKSIFKAHQKGAIKGRRAKYWGSFATKEEVAGLRMTKEASVAMALNSGSPDNLAVLIKGLGKFRKSATSGSLEYATKKEIDTYLKAALSDADWKLVNDIWDHLDKDIWPILSKVYKEMTGLPLKKVKGKYYPIHDDILYRDKQTKLTDMMLQADRKKFVEEVETSFVRARVGGAKSIKLTLDPLTKHLRDVVHTTTHWKAINDAQKLIKTPKFKEAVESTMGPKIYAQFEPWLSNLAKPFRGDPANKGLDRMLRHLRGGVTIGVLGLVPTTAVKQSLSLLTALPKTGVVNTAEALYRFGINPLGMMRSVAEASPQMAYRIRTWQRDLAEMASTIKPKDIGLPDGLKPYYFKMIHTVDRMTASIVWQSAYIKGLKKFEGNAHRAVDLADSVIRQTQPMSAAKDLPAMMRSGEVQRSISMFYSYFSVWHNQAAELIQRGLAGDMNRAKAIGTLMFISTAPVLGWELMSTTGNAIVGRDPKIDELPERLVKGTAMMTVSGIPIGRDIVASALLGYEFKMSPITDVGTEIVDIGKGMFTDEEWTRRHTMSVVELAGYLGHLPSREAVTVLEGGLRLIEGKTDDPTELFIKARKR